MRAFVKRPSPHQQDHAIYDLQKQHNAAVQLGKYLPCGNFVTYLISDDTFLIFNSFPPVVFLFCALKCDGSVNNLLPEDTDNETPKYASPGHLRRPAFIYAGKGRCGRANKRWPLRCGLCDHHGHYNRLHTSGWRGEWLYPDRHWDEYHLHRRRPADSRRDRLGSRPDRWWWNGSQLHDFRRQSESTL